MHTWEDVMPLIVRGLINDLDDSNQTYSDEKIQQLILTCAQLVKPELDFNNSYTINFATASISPDPIQTYDDGFINLVSMKTATLIIGGELRNLAANSLRVSDAGASIDTTSSYNAMKSLYDQMLNDYSRAKIEYVLGNVSELRAILSPYTVFYYSYNYTNVPNNIIFG